MSEPPRFQAPALHRERMRLAAALGILAAAALATSGLAKLIEAGPVVPRRTATSEQLWNPAPPELVDPATRLERRVREAEEATARARTALAAARRTESLDPALLSEFEARLERLGDTALDVVRRNYAPPPEPVDEQGRPHIRAIAPAPRNL